MAKRLLETNDESVLLQIKEVFESQDKDFWTDLPPHAKAGIQRAQKQASEGNLTLYHEVKEVC